MAEMNTGSAAASDSGSGGSTTPDSGSTGTQQADGSDGATPETTTDTAGGETTGQAAGDDSSILDSATIIDSTVQVDDGMDEFSRYAVGKGYDIKDLKSESFKRAVTAQREMEKNMGRLQAERDRLHRESLSRAAKEVESVNAPQKSPIDELNEQIGAQVSFECEIYGCTNQEELAQMHPEVFRKLEQMYHQKTRDLQQKEIDWRIDQREKKASGNTEQQRIEQEFNQVKQQARENLAQYRQKDKTFDMNMVKHGAAENIQRLSQITGIPVEYFHADKKFMGFLAPLISAAELVKSGELQKRTKTEVEAAIKKAKTAELPGDTPLPDDHEALMFARIQKKGRTSSIFE